MNIVLIAPYPDITALGVRYLSAALEAHGHTCRILFIPAPLNGFRTHSEFTYPYTEKELAEISSYCTTFDVIGMSFMSQYYERAIQLRNYLAPRTQAPIVWGGIHPTICPDQAMEYVDFVCRGEGEEAFVEFCDKLQSGENVTSCKNFWIRKRGEILKNDLRPLIADLDTLHWPDYRFDRHVVLDRVTESLYPLSRELVSLYLASDAISRSRNPSSGRQNKALYQTMATRGCPHHCSFCYNNEFRKLYETRQYVRRRSVDNIIGELKSVTDSQSPFHHIVLCDDSFFAASEREIADFSVRYKAEIGLPFHCLGSPQTISRNKLHDLVDAGLLTLSMGIQSGSVKTNELYERHFREAQVISAVETINQFVGPLMPPALDFIIDNPFESSDDERDSLLFILKLPRPFHLCLGSLVFYPGTPLYETAKEAGILTDEFRQIYRKEYHTKRGTYLNVMFYLAGTGIPRSILTFLMSPPLIFIFHRRIFSLAYVFFFRMIRFLKLFIGWLKTPQIDVRSIAQPLKRSTEFIPGSQPPNPDVPESRSVDTISDTKQTR